MKHEACIVPNNPSVKVGVGKLVERFLKQAATWTTIYLWGYFALSPGWLFAPLILSVLRYQWKKEKEFKISSAQVIAEASEKEVILARVQDLPSWVFFPDFERSEWLNRVIDQLWPSIGHFITLTLTGKLEPLIQKSLEEFSLKDFKFDHVLLGNIPPRIGGIKCYEKSYTSRDEIILDLEVTWASDCDMSVEVKGLKASVLDLYINGHIRVVLKPIIHTLPLLGGVQFYFLNNPSIDFAVGGLANVTDLPGINSILRRVITEQIASFAVLPNKISFPFVDDIPLKVFKCPEPQGLLRVTIVEAKNLISCDFGLFGRGKSDPYVLLSIGAKKFKTKYVKKTVNPVFDETWESIVEIVKSQTLEIEVWDWDQGKDDDFMGRARVPIQVLAEKGMADMWITLEDTSSGQIRIRTEWFTMSTNIQDYDDRTAETHGTQLSTSVLLVYVDSCKQLPLARSLGFSNKPDSVVQISVSSRNEEQQETRPVKCNRNPVFETGFIFLVNNPELDDVNLKVYDERSKGTLGLLRLNLSNLFEREGMEYFNQPFKLKKASSADSTITLYLKLFFTKRVRGRKRRITGDSNDLDSVSVLSFGEVDQDPFDYGLQKHSVISGSSVDDLFVQNFHDSTLTLDEGDDDVGEIDEPRSCVIIGSGQREQPRLLLSLSYDNISEILTLTIHKAEHLPSNDKQSDLPDPFVKIVLVLEKPRRRKTEHVSSSLDPVWDESFSFTIPKSVVTEREMELVILDKKGLFIRSSPLCRTIVKLKECGDLMKEKFHGWILLSSLESS